MNYSIIIPAYNEAEELPATLASARAAMEQQSLTGELIVVDNNSTDKTTEVAWEHGADRVVFEGFNQISRARNAGAEVSTGDYFIFIDADTRIKPELLSESLEKLKAGTHVGGGAVVHFDQPTNTMGRFGIRLWEKLSTLTQTAAGSYLFCRREAFEAEGGFDEKLYASEEVRMSKRLKHWGKRNGQRRFEILTEHPVLTSARKLDWYSGPQMLGFILTAPLVVRSRKLAAFWYKRPKAKA